MFEDEQGDNNFEETVRSILSELGRSVERAVDKVDAEEIADAIGVDPAAAREWIESAGGWLRQHAESLGSEFELRLSGLGQQGAPKQQPGADKRVSGGEDPLRSAAPHPLDLPTDEQGLALAALDSGRWTVEPGTDALTVKRDGPGPSDALGLVRELRVRDWIAADGEITLAGGHALARWLEATTPR
jgi:hypothetical protein